MNEKILKVINSKSSEYRSIPFWSWNDDLEPQELCRQIEWMNSQGFGGYFMHARAGLITPYLSERWFECVEACMQKGKELGMDSWAYDENGWPSGFAGGELLKDKENCDKFLTTTVGKYDKNAFVSYSLDGDKLQRVEGGENVLNVFVHYSPSTADILNPEVVKKFINLTHEQYKTHAGKDFSKKLKGFFTDEPQYQRWNQPYTDMIKKYFAETYNQDVLDGLGLLFVEKEGYREFRYKYWKGMQRLFLDGFAKMIYNWCDENGVELTGHYVEEPTLVTQMMCNSGIMPFYEYEHIPGMDWLGREIATPVAPKQVGSVARQTGKKKVLSEMFALVGWDATPLELKRIAEWQYVSGVNLMCQHLLPYSERGQRKRDYPAHFSWANPWVRENFKGFNDYFTTLGCLLGESEEPVSVAVLSPIRSMYFDYKREHVEMPLNEIDNSYLELCTLLSRYNIPYHIIDETMMAEKSSVKDGKLKLGLCEYDTVVFPKMYTMDKTSEELFNEFYKTGGKMLFTHGLPEYLEWYKYDYAFASNITLEEIANNQEFTISNVDTGIQSTLREIEGKKFIYAVNLDTDKEYTVTFNGDFKGFTCFDLESKKSYPMSNTVHFKPYQSYVLFLSDTAVEKPVLEQATTLSAPFKIVDRTDNYLTLDCLSYSTDGESFNDPHYTWAVFDQLLKDRYQGELYLKYTFSVKDVPKKICLLAEDMNTIECTVNGVPVTFNGSSDFEKQIYKADVAPIVKVGENEIVFKINYFQKDFVYYALFGENVTEGLRNCLTYDTNIEAVYLCGDFGVYAKDGFKPGKEENVLLGNDFYIAKPKTEIVDTVSEGYPFFAGKMTFEKEFDFAGDRCVIKLDGRYCLSELVINGKKVEKSYFANEIEVTDYLTLGKNVAHVTLYSGNRNLLGPHHCKHYEEPKILNISKFTLEGTWNNMQSTHFRDSYSFVKFGLFND